MTPLSKPLDAQADCPLFGPMFPSEIRNQIYALVYTIETSEEDGSIKLDGATSPPSKALTMTCERLHNETLAMYRVAYRNFPNHTFTIDMMSTRTLPPTIPRSLGNDILSRINSFHVTWNAAERNKDAPLRFTTYFDRDTSFHGFNVKLKLRDGDSYWRGNYQAREVIEQYKHIAVDSIQNFRRVCASRPPAGDALGKVLSRAISGAVFDPRWDERIWARA
jgi:hypothetical protein